MARREEWQKEIDTFMRHESWSMDQWNCPVKVVPLSPEYKKTGAHFLVGGYFTTSSAIIGKTPLSIERSLGLKTGCMVHGSRVLRLNQLPGVTQYEYQLTAFYPDGLAFGFMSSPDYPPGDKSIHQFQLKQGIKVKASFWRDLRPNEIFRP